MGCPAPELADAGHCTGRPRGSRFCRARRPPLSGSAGIPGTAHPQGRESPCALHLTPGQLWRTDTPATPCLAGAYGGAGKPLCGSRQALVNAENADRAELYKLEAANRNTTVDEVTLGYYLASLEHINKGTWAERYNKSTGNWEWFQWEQ
jgi:Protein of unknown function (DUF1318)